jgi:hypothetical protein
VHSLRVRKEPQQRSIRARKGCRQSPDGKSMPRKYAFACRRCKSRKTRCDGAQPDSGLCRRSGAACIYEKKHSDFELKRANERIQYLENCVRHLSGNLEQSTAEPAVLATSNLWRNGTVTTGEDTPTILEDAAWSTITLANSQAVAAFETTSRYHTAEGFRDSPRALERNAQFDRRDQLDHLRVLKQSHKLVDTVWQPLILSRSEHDLGVPPPVAWRLLDYFWTWQNPIHGCIYKPGKW